MKLSFQLHVTESFQISPELGLDDASCQFVPNSRSKMITVLQLFGRTETDSVCVNVRGLYPYFFVEYPENTFDIAALERFSIDIGNQIEQIVGRGSIYKICCVKGRRYYGFDQFKRPFFKICFFTTYHCKRAAEAINSSRIMSKRLLCCETHIPFELQFLVDHNIYGMGRVNVHNAEQAILKHSCLHQEFNVHARDILNRQELFPFYNSRPDGLGHFPDRHLMPSVVQMLSSMGFDPFSLLIDLKERKNSSRVRIEEFEKHDIIEEKNLKMESECLEVLRLLPAANDPYLQDFERDFQITPNEHSFMQLLKSPLFGSQISINEDEKTSAASCSSSSPIRTPTKPRTEETFKREAKTSTDTEEEVEQYLEDMLEEAETQCILNYASSSPIKTPIKRKAHLRNSMPQKITKGFYRPQPPPPTLKELEAWSEANPNFPWAVHQAPFFSKFEDRPAKPVIIGGARCEVPMVLKRPFPGSRPTNVTLPSGTCLIPALPPPKVSLLSEEKHEDHPILSSQITGITQPEKFPQSLKSQLGEKDNFVLFSLEIYAQSNQGKLPDPKHNQVQMAVYSVYQKGIGYIHGCIAQGPIPNSDCIQVSSEEELFEGLIELITEKYNADILLGYEVQMSSWGFLEERWQGMKEESFAKRLSRKTGENAKEKKSEFVNEWERRKTSTFQVYGRIVLNVWRIMRSELSLSLYTFENVSSQVLKYNFPKFAPAHLDSLFASFNEREKLFCYYNVRSKGNVELLIKTEVLSRSCEFARLFGVDIFSVLTRGSQLKVESLMARLAHLDNFLLFSPSKEDVSGMRAAEQTPLIMEPAGETYVDPVIVLDFQSLYPSIMIAYNFCFSTLIKRIERDDGRIGALRLGNEVYSQIHDPIIAVNGTAFTPKSLRQGVMPKMQTELLDARLQIKKRMKTPGVDPVELKILDARQLALKYILNVSYGYTAASFSGRMPCVDVADAIVGTGRATMDRAIRLIESHAGWRAKVVYGDTDSLFVLVPGRTRTQAFKIGQEISEAITAQNPPPMALKLEKVYQPCCLMSKKRYVGFKYESPDQSEPVFDAKGIETVRRDSCPLVSQVLEKSIRILFTTKDISQVKGYVTRQFQKICKGARYDLQTFVFARQVKFGTYRHEGVVTTTNEHSDDESEGSDREETSLISTRLPPSAHLAAKRMQKDPRDVAQYGERIPFVVIENGSSRLVDQVVSPEDLFLDPTMKINSSYYITRQILPAVARVLNTVRVEPRMWWASMAKNVSVDPTRKGIGKFFTAANCWFCKQPDSNMRINTSLDGDFKFQVCQRCWNGKKYLSLQAYASALYSSMQISNLGNEAKEECWGTDPFDPKAKCWSLSCPVFWKSVALNRKEILRYCDCLRVLEHFDLHQE